MAHHDVEGIGVLEAILGGVVLKGIAFARPRKARRLDPQWKQKTRCITPREIGSDSI
jgi:hypothetical protein